MKAQEKLWKNRANELLQRNDIIDETSNLDDESPDNEQKNNGGREQTWRRPYKRDYWII